MLKQLKIYAKQLKQELRVYRLLLKHPHTPLLAKLLLALAIGYLLLPFDLIPDFIPVLGQLDELIVIPLLVYLAVLLIPNSLLLSCRVQARAEPAAQV